MTNQEQEIEPPSEFMCSLTMDIMNDPVVSRYGQSFEREAIIQWLARGNTTCPMTRRPLRLSDLITNHQLRAKIRRWQIENGEDVTVIAGSGEFGEPSCFGFLNLPERDPDETERESDDPVRLMEHRRHHHRSSSSHRTSSTSSRRHRTRTSSNRASTEARPTSRRTGFFGMFQSRRAITA